MRGGPYSILFLVSLSGILPQAKPSLKSEPNWMWALFPPCFCMLPWLCSKFTFSLSFSKELILEASLHKYGILSPVNINLRDFSPAEMKTEHYCYCTGKPGAVCKNNFRFLFKISIQISGSKFILRVLFSCTLYSFGISKCCNWTLWCFLLFPLWNACCLPCDFS